MHPDYDTGVYYRQGLIVGTADNDIALLLLATPIQYSASVQPVCLPPTDPSAIKYTRCYITGWGATVPDSGRWRKGGIKMG